MKLLHLLLTALLLGATTLQAAEFDVVVYGATSGGVIAAVQAKKMGKSVVLVSPDKHLGGLSSGGLGFTDTGNKAVIGGLSREFYHRVWKHYDGIDAWKWQKREEYGNQGQGTPAIDGEQRTMWIFEPHVAENIFEDFVRENRIPVYRDEWLDREKGVKKNGARIASITTLSGKTYAGKMFIDATYEGDLMAAAGVSYHVGREATSTYGEQWNGVQTGVLHHRHHFGVLKTGVSPYVVPGDPKSGVLPRISTAPPGEKGAGDKLVQAYCYRMCLSNHPENRIPFAKPEGYDPKQYELLARVYAAGWDETFDKYDPIPNRKTDTNNHGPMSTDNIGFNYDYPDASYARRREILREHEAYQKGWLYFVANDPRVPEKVRAEMQQWGLPKDEFTDNGGWSHQIYVREARRLVGSYVMTENELLKKRPTPDSVGMGSYGIDSHNIQRYITPEGFVQNEGDIGVSTKGPYEIAYGSLVPKPGEADNLLVPVCVSSSHIAFGSIRMEPVFMILGQSAATAAVIAIDAGIPVQQVSYPQLRTRLLADGQVLEYTAPKPAPKSTTSKSTTSKKNAGETRADTAAGKNSAMTPIEDVPELPRVLLIGDSISIGYTLDVRAGLKGRANVHRIPANGGATDSALTKLDQWLGGGRWDIIHFNFGIHDAKFTDATNHRTSREQYEQNLRAIVSKLKATGAKLIFATTTPIPNGGVLAADRRFDDVVARNDIALRVMRDSGVAVDDLFAVADPVQAKILRPGDLHYTPEGYALLARAVVESIERQLPPKPSKRPLDHTGQIAATLEPSRKLAYKKVGDRELHLHIFEPQGHQPTDRRACLVTIHGGGWTGGEPRRMYPFAAHAAKLGMLGISVEYRLLRGSSTVFDCVQDGRSALRYVRAHAAEIGIDPQKIVVNGSSAGGHVAASTALFEGVDEAGEDTSVSCVPNAMVLFFPVIDTSKAGYGQAKIGDRWKELSPVDQVRSGVPPTLIFHGTADPTTPFAGVEAFQRAMLAAGNRCELVSHEGGDHGYFMRDRILYDNTLQKIDAFLASLGWMTLK